MDLYNWSNETAYAVPGSEGNYISISSADSVNFSGGMGTNPYIFVVPVLAGDINTTPGATYEISFTMQDLNLFEGSASESFGAYSTNFNLPVVDESGDPGYYDLPVNIDFTAVATSATTMMSFQCFLDNDGAATLDHLMVTEVPETSTTRLFLYGGCALLLAKKLQKLAQKRKLALKRIA